MNLWGRKLKGGYCLDVISVYRNMILKCILKKLKKKKWKVVDWIYLAQVKGLW